MTKEIIIFITITVMHLSSELNVDTHDESKYSRYEFVLHKCTATAQLIRKRQNEETLNSNSSKPIDNLLHKAYMSFTMQGKNSTSQQVQSTMNDKHSFGNSETNYNNISVKRLFTKSTTNTPLRTLNIKSMQSLLPVFTKKIFLPEVEDVTVETKNLSQSVIVIKTAV